MKSFFRLLAFVFLAACGTAPTTDGTAPTTDEKEVRAGYTICGGLNGCAKRITHRVRMQSHWVCERKAMGKKSVVFVEVGRDGTILVSRIIESSKDPQFDRKSMEAVSRSAPFLEMRGLSDKDFAAAKELSFTFAGGEGCEGKMK